MRAAHHTLGSLLAAIAAIAATQACAPLGQGVLDDDAALQACAERALRRRPEPALALEAFALYTAHCSSGDSAACSSLGVMHEHGLATRVDLPRALALYEGSCAGGNARGCANLGAALARGHGGPGRVGEGVRRLSTMCHARDMYACHEHASTLVHGGPSERRSAQALFELSCDAGETAACASAAELLRDEAPTRTRELFTTACVAGEAAACDSLARLAPSPGPRPTLALPPGAPRAAAR